MYDTFSILTFQKDERYLMTSSFALLLMCTSLKTNFHRSSQVFIVAPCIVYMVILQNHTLIIDQQWQRMDRMKNYGDNEANIS